VSFCCEITPFLIFGPVTAFFFSCFVPTLFFGNNAFPAAIEVPPSATNSARRARVAAHVLPDSPQHVCQPPFDGYPILAIVPRSASSTFAGSGANWSGGPNSWPVVTA
jgi:hypothetical protein